jgi:hypothetical protein
VKHFVSMNRVNEFIMVGSGVAASQA